MDEAGDEVPDVVDCQYPLRGMCWPCLTDFLRVLHDLPYVFCDLEVGMAQGLDGAEAAHHDLVRALEAFAVEWLDAEHDEWSDREVLDLAGELKEQLESWESPVDNNSTLQTDQRLPPRMLRPVVLAVAAKQFLYNNVDEPELPRYACDVSTAAMRAREVISIWMKASS